MNNHGMSGFATELASKVKGLVAEHDGINQAKIAETLGRSQGYVSARMTGKEPWTTDDLDGIAVLLGMEGIELMVEVMRRGTWCGKSAA